MDATGLYLETMIGNKNGVLILHGLITLDFHAVREDLQGGFGSFSWSAFFLGTLGGRTRKRWQAARGWLTEELLR